MTDLRLPICGSILTAFILRKPAPRPAVGARLGVIVYLLTRSVAAGHH